MKRTAIWRVHGAGHVPFEGNGTVQRWYRFNECLRIGVTRPVEQQFCGPTLHDATQIHHEYSVGEVADDVEVV
jgi:hypothetical protein